MTVTLTQSTEGHFPDRPGDGGGVSLHVSVTGGGDGAFLEWPLSPSLSSFHLRLLLRPDTITGGEIAIARGLDNTDTETWRLVLDAANDQIAFRYGDGNSLTANFSRLLPWTCVEITIDADSDERTLWLNGVEADTESGALTINDTLTLHLGGFLRNSETTGTYLLDEITISAAYIGPVVVPPTGTYGNDPARWAVVYNTNDSDSIVWANAYRDARQIPLANFIGLALATDETIDAAAYAALDGDIQDYLERNGLTDQIVGLLFGYKVPGIVDFLGGQLLGSVPSLMHTSGSSSAAVFNPFAADALPARPTTDDLTGYRLTARIDAPTLGDAIALIDRSTTIDSLNLGEGDETTIFLDAATTPSPVNDPEMTKMLNWAASVDRQHTRLPIERTTIELPSNEINFESIQNDGFFWGWAQTQPSAGFFAEPAGTRVFATQIATTLATAATLRNATPGNWVEHALVAGYAAAAGTIDLRTPDTNPFIRPFFEAIRQGWTLGEAWFLAIPRLRGAFFLVGDPLMTVALPKAGWDIYGPIGRLEDIKWSEPLVRLRENELTYEIDPNDRPADGAFALFAVRHIDDRGRPSNDVSTIRLANVGGIANMPPDVPIGPQQDGWPVAKVSNQLRFAARWDRRTGDANVESVSLIGETSDGTQAKIHAQQVSPHERLIQFDLDPPTVTTRYRWQIDSPQGAIVVTPWSELVDPTPTPVHVIQSAD